MSQAIQSRQTPIFQNTDRSLALCILLTLLGLMLTTACNDSDDDARPEEIFDIGILLPLTGSASSAGESVQAGIDLAMGDANGYMQSIGDPLKLRSTIRDTETDPDAALAQLKELYQQGIRHVIGPYSSANCAAVLDYANQNGILLLSPSSVASSLAIADDNLFRMAPADVNQAEAISALFSYDNIQVVIPVVRDDVWGDGLMADVMQHADDVPLTLHNPIQYDPSNYNSTSIASSVAVEITQLLQQYEAAQVAVYLLSFGEGTDILEAAAGEPDCALVNWYGSSAYAKSVSLAENSVAANFAIQQMFRCPSFAPDPAAVDLWEPFTQRLEAELGREPEVYALTSNDAVWLLAHARHEQFGNADIESFKDALTGVAAYQYGITGRLLFNAYGDREQSTYDFWGLSASGGPIQWTSYGQFSSTDGLTIY